MRRDVRVVTHLRITTSGGTDFSREALYIERQIKHHRRLINCSVIVFMQGNDPANRSSGIEITDALRSKRSKCKSVSLYDCNQNGSSFTRSDFPSAVHAAHAAHGSNIAVILFYRKEDGLVSGLVSELRKANPTVRIVIVAANPAYVSETVADLAVDRNLVAAELAYLPRELEKMLTR
ncbi:hypothetical protein HZC07_04085 [Candidatus Micrarchaeota archaeon]|nr:hypothetical protein [Candidatus Micrarchaeota archaeon]